MSNTTIVAFPPLLNAFSAVESLRTLIDSIQWPAEQPKTLTHFVEAILRALSKEYKTGRATEDQISGPTQQLTESINEIYVLFQRQAKSGLLKWLYTKEDRVGIIDVVHRRLSDLVQVLRVDNLIDTQGWAQMNTRSRARDQDNLREFLKQIAKSARDTLQELGVTRDNHGPMVTSISKRLKHKSTEDHFLSRAMEHITFAYHRKPDPRSWMITTYDVDFVAEVGSSGFGKVYKGYWYGALVALKTLVFADMIPTTATLEREICTWPTLAHPHILSFIGADTMGDDGPFLVMPYMSKGNAHQYIHRNPKCNRIKILHEVILGLGYLHSRDIVHGSLKATNVLIGDDDKAVLCDFGLYAMKLHLLSGASRSLTDISVENPFWMSPELLLGHQADKSSDVYAFGMVILEIYTNRIPLPNLEKAEFRRSVLEGRRPKRPQSGDNMDIVPEEMWQLANRCWEEKLKRPSVEFLRGALIVQHAVLPISSQIQQDGSPQTQGEKELCRKLTELQAENEKLSLTAQQAREESDKAQQQFQHELEQEKEKYLNRIQVAEHQVQENARSPQQLQYENSNAEPLVSQSKPLESQTRELAVAQRFLTTADSLPGADVIRMVSKLNDEILQCAAHLAESLSGAQLNPAKSDHRDAAQTEVWELGFGIFELLKTFSTSTDPSMALQIAFQACFNYCCAYIIRSWHREETLETAFKGVYHELQQTVAPSVAAKWRALTTANLDRLQERNDSTFPGEVMEFLLRKTLAIMTIAGFRERRSKLSKELKSNLQWMTKTTLELRTAVSQQVSWSEMEVFLIPVGQNFDPRIMTDDSSNGRKGAGSSVSRGVVFSTTDLGLKSVRAVTNEEGTTESVEEILLKPKVLLQSTVEEMLTRGSVPNLPEDRIEFYCDP